MTDQTRTYISSRNRGLARRAALSQPSLDETVAKPMPAHIPGQLSLFRDRFRISITKPSNMPPEWNGRIVPVVSVDPWGWPVLDIDGRIVTVTPGSGDFV